MLIEINKENIIQDSDNINKIVADFIENNITSIAMKKDFIAIFEAGKKVGRAERNTAFAIAIEKIGGELCLPDIDLVTSTLKIESFYEPKTGNHIFRLI